MSKIGPAPPERPSDALFGESTAVSGQPVVLTIQQNVIRSANGEEDTGFGINSVFRQCPHCNYQGMTYIERKFNFSQLYGCCLLSIALVASCPVCCWYCLFTKYYDVDHKCQACQKVIGQYNANKDMKDRSCVCDEMICFAE